MPNVYTHQCPQMISDLFVLRKIYIFETYASISQRFVHDLDFFFPVTGQYRAKIKTTYMISAT